MASIKEDLDSWDAYIRSIIDQFTLVTPEICLEALKPTFEKSKVYCPKDTGALVASGYLENVGFRGKPRIEMGYAKGGNPFYAVVVHENIEMRHQAPERAQWLLAALEEDEGAIETRIISAYRYFMGGGGGDPGAGGTSENASHYSDYSGKERYKMHQEMHKLSGSNNLSKDEHKLIHAYQTTEDHRYVNEALRLNKTGLDSHENHAAAIEHAIQKTSLPTDSILYRGLGHNTITRQPNYLVPGSTVKDRGFSSTTIFRGRAEFFKNREGGSHILQILAPRGSKALFPREDGNLHEYEVILHRNSRLRILHVDNGVITARLLHPHEN